MDALNYEKYLSENGYIIVDDFYTIDEVIQMGLLVENATVSGPAFRKTNDLFAIRLVLIEIPELAGLVFNSRLRAFINSLFGKGYFVVKSIYFDKPGQSNWFVAWHQDITISAKNRIEANGFTHWLSKHNQYSVQPPVEVLQNIFTIRIHLDDTNENNGALKVIKGSHTKGIIRPESIDWDKETPDVCCVNRGGLMIMKPLLLHASSKTTNQNNRRVIHIEFSNLDLPNGMDWAELQYLD